MAKLDHPSWEHASAIRWYANRIQNTAVSAYMCTDEAWLPGGDTIRDALTEVRAQDTLYNRILMILHQAYEQLHPDPEDLPVRPNPCQPPFCHGDRGRCVPCLE